MNEDYVNMAVPKGAMPRVVAAINAYLNEEGEAGPSQGSRPPTGPRGEGWTQHEINRMVEESSPAAKALLELLAKRAGEWLTSEDQAEPLRSRQSDFGGTNNEAANWNTVAGTMGALGRRVKSRYGLALPIEFREDPQGRWLRRMSPEIAELVLAAFRDAA